MAAQEAWYGNPNPAQPVCRTHTQMLVGAFGTWHMLMLTYVEGGAGLRDNDLVARKIEARFDATEEIARLAEAHWWRQDG